MITAYDIQMSILPAAVMCPATEDKTTGTGFGWNRLTMRGLRLRHAVVSANGRANPGSGVT